MFTILVEPYIYDKFLDKVHAHTPKFFRLIRVDFNNPPASFSDLLSQADAILGEVTLSEAEHQQASNLKIIQTIRAGYDRVDLQRAAAFGVAVANNGGANAISVAEHTFLLILALYRQLLFHHHSVVEGPWENRKESNLEMAGKTLGIVGMGHVGQAVAKRALAFETKVLYYDILRADTKLERQWDLHYCPLNTLLQHSDIVTYHVPLSQKTRQMINQDSLQQMQRHSLLINTSRGEIQDEAALFEALSTHQIAGAGLDVFQTEPLPTDSPLRRLSNVVFTPHAAPSRESRPRTIENAMINLQRVALGESPQHLAVDYDHL